MKPRLLIFVCVALLAVSLVGWSQNSNANEEVWIDVRSKFEYALDSISTDLNIGHLEIVSGVRELQIGTDAAIALYCRSGVRAERAKQALLDAGYTRVRNIGSIDEARRERQLSD